MNGFFKLRRLRAGDLVRACLISLKDFSYSPFQSNDSVSGLLVASYRGLDISPNPGIQILQNPAMPKKVWRCFFVCGVTGDGEEAQQTWSFCQSFSLFPPENSGAYIPTKSPHNLEKRAGLSYPHPRMSLMKGRGNEVGRGGGKLPGLLDLCFYELQSLFRSPQIFLHWELHGQTKRSKTPQKQEEELIEQSKGHQRDWTDH